MYPLTPAQSSHQKFISSYNQNQQSYLDEQNHQDFGKYLNNPNDNYSNKLKKQIILTSIQSINTELINITKQKFGDLTLWSDNASGQPDQQWKQVQKTINLVKILLSNINRDCQIKKEFNQKLRKMEDQQGRMNVFVQKLEQEKKNLQKSKENLELKIKTIERQFKQDIEKLKKEKQQSDRKFNQILSRENHYKNQFRNNELTISQLQQKLKTKTSDKGNVKNTFQKIQDVKNYGPAIILSNCQNEFNQFFVSNFQSTYHKIVEENQYLKKCLHSIYQELHSLLENKKEIIKKRKGYNTALQSDAFELETLRLESLSLPKQFSKDSISKLNENLFKFKQAIKIHDRVNEKVSDEKIQCVNNVKSLINNYKDIVQHQDKLINKIVLKSKQYKTNQIQNIESKFSKALEQDDIERSKKFLQEQREILMARNKQLEMTRKAMKNTIKKAEEEKRLFQKKKIQTNQQLQNLKRNIENIPAIVQQQLANMN